MEDTVYWYHGTNEHFTQWAVPPAITKYKAALHPHPFLSLTKDLVLAKGAGEASGGLCRAKLINTAKVLDLRQMSEHVRRHWELVVRTDLGRHHALIQRFDSWAQACISGEVLRLHTFNQEILSMCGPLGALAKNRSVPIQVSNKAHLDVQNFTRLWINAVISPAKQLGYQAVICAEVDRERPSPKGSLNLYVFDPQALTAPEWASVPDEARMLADLKRLEALGVVT